MSSETFQQKSQNNRQNQMAKHHDTFSKQVEHCFPEVVFFIFHFGWANASHSTQPKRTTSRLCGVPLCPVGCPWPTMWTLQLLGVPFTSPLSSMIFLQKPVSSMNCHVQVSSELPG